MKKLALAVVLVMCVTLVAQADVVRFREGGGYLSADVDATFDDHEMSTLYGGYHNWDTWRHSTGIHQGNVFATMTGIKDMFDLLPKTQGILTLQVNSATLTYTCYGQKANPELSTHRVLTDWMPLVAGDNEEPTSMYSPVENLGAADPVVTPWAAGNFSPADYSAPSDVKTEYALEGPEGETPIPFDVTTLVQDMYATETNYGFVLLSTIDGTWRTYAAETDPGDGYGRATRDNYLSLRPMLRIDYNYVPEPATMSLLVLGGLGALIRRRR